jgi:hypothetical protein
MVSVPAGDPMNLIYDEPFIKVRPVESRALLAYPHKGIATYQRFARDPLNDPNEEKPTDDGPLEFSSSHPAETRPAVPPSTVAYLRWFWARIEPEPGKRRWDVVDRALAIARQRGQSVQLRLMPGDSWLDEKRPCRRSWSRGQSRWRSRWSILPRISRGSGLPTKEREKTAGCRW